MNEVERIRARVAAVEAEQRQAEQNWQRADGALQVLRHMLGEALRADDLQAAEAEAGPQGST